MWNMRFKCQLGVYKLVGDFQCKKKAVGKKAGKYSSWRIVGRLWRTISTQVVEPRILPSSTLPSRVGYCETDF